MTLETSLQFCHNFMVIIDTISRSMFAAEIPISVLTSIIGAPFFIYMLRSRVGVKL